MGSRLAALHADRSARGCPLRAHANAVLFGLAILFAACACGDKPPRAQSPRPPSDDGNAESHGADDGDASAVAVRDAGIDAPLTGPECRALVDHVVAIAMQRFRDQAAEQGKPIPTEAQLQEIRSRLQKELGTACLEMPRRDYDCAMGARSAAALEACAAPPPPVDN